MWKWTLTDANGVEHVETTDNFEVLRGWFEELSQTADGGQLDNVVIEWLGD